MTGPIRTCDDCGREAECARLYTDLDRTETAWFCKDCLIEDSEFEAYRLGYKDGWRDHRKAIVSAMRSY